MQMKKAFRSGLEERIAEQLDKAGIEYNYEGQVVPYSVPARTARYLPDFPIAGTNIVIEGKGNFGAGAVYGGRYVAMQATSAKERQKFALLREQHPELDIRFVFSKAKAPIYKGSPTTHGAWADTHGFLWCEKKIPAKWIREIKAQQRKT
jgi:hypothetical protein